MRHPGLLKSGSATPFDTASKPFCEITGKMNAVSRSTEQDSKHGITKMEVKEKNAGKSNSILRRHSVASKLSSNNTEKIKAIPGGNPNPDAKLKRASLQGTVHDDKNITQQAGRSSNRLRLWRNSTTTRITNVAKGNGKTHPPQCEQDNIHTRSSIRTVRKLASGLVKDPAITGNGDFKTLGPRDPTSLRTASYWLDQVKLAEAIEKHAVAIGFFRLAIECEAEPLQMLREELIMYRRRHGMFLDSINQVLLCYGIIEEVEGPPFLQVPTAGISVPSLPWEHKESPQNVFETDSVPQQSPVELSCAADAGAEINSATKAELEEHLGAEKAELSDEADAHPVIQDVPNGHVVAMDVDSLTREVVSYIMSSLDNCSSPAVKDGVALVGLKSGQESITSSINAETSTDHQGVSESKIAHSHELKDSASLNDSDITVSNSCMPYSSMRKVISVEDETVVQEVSSIDKNAGKLSLLGSYPERLEKSDTNSQDVPYNGNKIASETDEPEVPQSVVDENASTRLLVQGNQEHGKYTSTRCKLASDKHDKVSSLSKRRCASLSSSKESSYSAIDKVVETAVHKLVSQHAEKKPVSLTPRCFVKAEACDAFMQASGSVTRNRAKSNTALVSNGEGGSNLSLETQLQSPIPNVLMPSQSCVSHSKHGSKEASVDTLEMRGSKLFAEEQAVTPGLSSVRRSARLRPAVSTPTVLTIATNSTITAHSTPRRQAVLVDKRPDSSLSK